jgi:hypothetical protein
MQELPIPHIDDNSVRVVLSNSQSSEYDETWEMMEQEFVEEGFKGLDAHGKPRVRPKLSSGDMCRTLCAVGGNILFSIVAASVDSLSRL